MEITPLLSPLLFGSVPHYDPLRRFPKPVEPAEVWAPLPPEPNFRIDDLLDFSNDDELCDELPAACGSMEREEAQAPSLNGGKDPNPSFSGGKELNFPRSSSALQEACQQASGGLCVPSDELADQLEWLSTFNEDSSYSGDRKLASLVSSGSLSGPKEGENRRAQDKFQSPSPVSVLEPSSGFCANTCAASSSQVHSRARSKRARSRVWSLDTLLPTLVDNRLGGAQESPVFFGFLPESESLFPSKKAKKVTPAFKPLVEAPSRRCSHCLVQKTPQWRAGPMGPKTLCNACGVRYKSGRLVPEYRPAGSPSFVSEVHSNSHKRILEMRRMKEVEEEQFAMGKEEEDEEEDYEEDCHSQTEPCKEDPIGSREDPNAPNCSEESPNGPIWDPNGMEEEEPIDPACSKEDPINPTCMKDPTLMKELKHCKRQERPTMVECIQEIEEEDSKEGIVLEQKEEDSNEESINSVN